MAESVQIVGLDEVRDLLKAIPENSFDSAKESIGKSILNIHTEVSSYSGGLNNRTGRLKRSLKTELKGENLDDLRGAVFTKTKYAPIQEVGGKISAKDKYVNVPGGPYLNIPLSANKTPAGVMRQNAGEVFNGGGYIVKSKTGKYIVMSVNNQPMFVLVKSVIIPPRLGMQKAADDEIPTLLGNLNSILLEGL